MKTCDRCGLPTWKRTGGMGGSIPPDYETYCDVRNGHSCRMRRASFVAGMRACLEIAKEKAFVSVCDTVSLSDVEKGIEEEATK